MTRSSAPVDLGTQSDLIGTPEPMSIEAVLAAPNGGYRAVATASDYDAA